MSSSSAGIAFGNISNLAGASQPVCSKSAFPTRGENSALTTWAPAVDIYETENELVLKADLPDINEKDIDIRVENNMLTVRGERKFEPEVKEDNYLRIERTYGSFSRSFGLPTRLTPKQSRPTIRTAC